MTPKPNQAPGPYTLSRLAQEATTQGPLAFRGLPDFVRGFTGEDRLDGATRVAIFLRLSKMLGCPVCRALFPKLAPSAGLDLAGVEAAIQGDATALTAQAAAAIAWVEAVMGADGAEPTEIPEAARTLTDPQRAHLLQAVRIERIVHATGLMFLPHTMIERAAGL